MKILFLAPYPPEQAPSQRFRFEQYFNILDKHGIEHKLEPFLDLQTWDLLYKEGRQFKKILGIILGFLRRVTLLFTFKKYDKVFVHRDVTPIGPPFFEWYIANVLNKEIIYDFDDAIWLANTSKENKLVTNLKWHSKTSLICKWAHIISAGNSFLASYASIYSQNVRINPTTIDTDYHLKIERQENKVPVIGWTGTHSTGRYLIELLPVLKELAEQHEFDFFYISNHAPEIDIPNLHFIEWNKETEVMDLNKIDIGVMPLSDDDWSKGKCGFKALQYMSLKIPALISPVGVNSEIIEDGVNGFLCNTNEDWKCALSLLINDKNKREEIGKAGRKTVEERYSVSANTENFLEILSA